MNIEEYKFIESGLYIKFNKSFKHIKLQKLENNKEENKDNNLVSLDYDSIELTFSKQKDNITLNISNQSDMIIIIVWEIDKENIDYQSYMFKRNCEINKDILLGSGLELLFTNKLQNLQQNEKVEDTKKKESNINCVIKNENIFAEIKRK